MQKKIVKISKFLRIKMIFFLKIKSCIINLSFQTLFDEIDFGYLLGSKASQSNFLKFNKFF